MSIGDIPALRADLEIVSTDATSEGGRNRYSVVPHDNPELHLATAAEGYLCSEPSGRPPIYTPTAELRVLEIERVSIPADKRRQGLATLVLAKVLKEGARRGFGVARLDVLNPHIISSLIQLHGQGVVAELAMFESMGTAAPSVYYLADKEPISPEQAIRTLQPNVETDGSLDQDKLPLLTQVCALAWL